MANHSLDRLVTSAGRMAHLCLGAMVLIPIMHALIWAGLVETSDVMGIQDVGAFVGADSTGASQKLGGFAMTMVPQLAVLYGLWRLKLLFEGMRHGEVFGAATADHMRGFSRALLFYAILDFIMQVPLSAFVSWSNPPGQRFVTIGIGWDDLYALFFILLFFAIARVLSEGIRLQRENAEFV